MTNVAQNINHHYIHPMYYEDSDVMDSIEDQSLACLYCDTWKDTHGSVLAQKYVMGWFMSNYCERRYVGESEAITEKKGYGKKSARLVE